MTIDVRSMSSLYILCIFRTSIVVRTPYWTTLKNVAHESGQGSPQVIAGVRSSSMNSTRRVGLTARSSTRNRQSPSLTGLKGLWRGRIVAEVGGGDATLA